MGRETDISAHSIDSAPRRQVRAAGGAARTRGAIVPKSSAGSFKQTRQEIEIERMLVERKSKRAIAVPDGGWTVGESGRIVPGFGSRLRLPRYASMADVRVIGLRDQLREKAFSVALEALSGAARTVDIDVSEARMFNAEVKKVSNVVDRRGRETDRLLQALVG